MAPPNCGWDETFSARQARVGNVHATMPQGLVAWQPVTLLTEGKTAQGRTFVLKVFHTEDVHTPRPGDRENYTAVASVTSPTLSQTILWPDTQRDKRSQASAPEFPDEGLQRLSGFLAPLCLLSILIVYVTRLHYPSRSGRTTQRHMRTGPGSIQ
ncbi:hypothetical protein Bbelb_425960 [Branchiostoma belcheri]|nr:hypothetical protein Bbelb_425960 [Branchiostoma belcheri]